MKEEYDFTNAEKGKFFIPAENTQLPVYLEDDVLIYLKEQVAKKKNTSIQTIVNELLRKDIDIIKALSS